jgi:hypothetical protein
VGGEHAVVSLTAAHGATDDGTGSFSMVSMQASGSAELVGAAVGMALGVTAPLRGDR